MRAQVLGHLAADAETDFETVINEIAALMANGHCATWDAMCTKLDWRVFQSNGSLQPLANLSKNHDSSKIFNGPKFEGDITGPPSVISNFGSLVQWVSKIACSYDKNCPNNDEPHPLQTELFAKQWQCHLTWGPHSHLSSNLTEQKQNCEAEPLQEKDSKIPLKCPFTRCPKRFRGKDNRSNLRRHIESVHNGTSFDCQWEGCNYHPNRNDNLLKHVKNIHLNRHSSSTCLWDISGQRCCETFSDRASLTKHVQKLHISKASASTGGT